MKKAVLLFFLIFFAGTIAFADDLQGFVVGNIQTNNIPEIQAAIRKLSLEKGKPITREKLSVLARVMAEHGYINPPDMTQNDRAFNIQLGPLFHFSHLTIKGPGEKNAEIRSTIEKSFMKKGAVYNQSIVISALDFLKSEGYHLASFKESFDNTAVSVVLNTGPLFHFAGFKLEGPGENDILLKKVIEKLDLTPGSAMKNDIFQALISAVKSQGYSDVNLVSPASFDSSQLDVLLVLDTGLQRQFGSVTFKQLEEQKAGDSTKGSPKEVLLKNPQFSDAFLKRYFKMNPGDLYHTEYPDPSTYFQSVRCKQDGNIVDNKVPVACDLFSKGNGQLSVGAGYNTGNGWNTNLNTKFYHLGQEGHYGDIKLNIAQLNDALSLNYYIPGTDPHKDIYKLIAQASQKRLDAGKYQKVDAQFSWDSTLGDGFSRNFGVTLAHERDYPVDDAARTMTFVMPSASLNYSTSNHALKPTRRYTVSAMVRGSPKTSPALASFLQEDLKVSSSFHITPASRLLLRGDLALTQSDQRGKNRVPLSIFWLRFLRGYGLLGQSGTYEKFISAEYQHKIIEINYKKYKLGSLWGMGFAEAGNASQHFSDPLKKSVGLGVVWDAPMGISVQGGLARVFDLPGKSYAPFFQVGVAL